MASTLTAERHMFMCKVLVGEYTVGNDEMRIPPDKKPGGPRYNSTVDDDKDPHIFVTYSDVQAYPVYKNNCFQGRLDCDVKLVFCEGRPEEAETKKQNKSAQIDRVVKPARLETCAGAHLHACTRMHIHTQTHIHTYIHTHTYTYTRTHIHTHTPAHAHIHLSLIHI